MKQDNLYTPPHPSPLPLPSLPSPSLLFTSKMIIKLSLAAISLQYCWGKFPSLSFPKPRKLHSVGGVVHDKNARVQTSTHAYTHPQKMSSLMQLGTFSVTFGFMLKKSLVKSP